MEQNIKRIIATTFIIVCVVIIIGYSIFRFKDYLAGPSITIHSPQNGTTTEPVIILRGATTNIKNITVNDRQILIDEKGNFGERLLLNLGYNTITIRGTDRFKKEIKKEILLFLPNTASSSTAPNTEIKPNEQSTENEANMSE